MEQFVKDQKHEIIKKQKRREEKRREKNTTNKLKREIQQWDRTYSEYHSISHIKRIFKWLPVAIGLKQAIAYRLDGWLSWLVG